MIQRVIWAVLKAALDLNAKLYGKGSSYELCRDLKGEYWEKPQGWTIEGARW